MRYMILGSGFQGRACAYDLLANPRTREVCLCDRDALVLETAREFLDSDWQGRTSSRVLDAADLSRVAQAMAGFDAVVSCVPYFLNLPLSEAAIDAGVHFVDLGGNTEIVRKQIALHEKARDAGVCILPDNGLGPGMISTLAVHAMNMLDRTDEVMIRDGGLPLDPVPPMNYLLTFSEHGLINEYVSPATALREGKVVQLPALSEVEPIELPPPLGHCEAAHAAGGLSTLAETYAGKVQRMDNKLIRYPGHIAVINAMTAMGYFSQEAVTLEDGSQVKPRDLSARLFRNHFDRPGSADIVVIHNTVTGVKDGRPARVTHTLVDRYDPDTGMTAMMRTTGFPASIVAQMAVDGRIQPGAYPVEVGVPPEAFVEEFLARGFDLRWAFRWLDE